MTEVERVRILLAKAVAPRLQANTRWIALDSSRKAFALPGKDKECAILSWLAQARPTNDQPLQAAAIMLGVGENPRPIQKLDYLSWYRQLNYGYPFLDYSKGETFEADQALMSAYSDNKSQPPVATPRSGESVGLRPGRF